YEVVGNNRCSIAVVKAVGLVVEGWSQADAAAHVGRSDRWLRSWLRRFEVDGVEGTKYLALKMQGLTR
ncbi:MAG: hypothetical protein DSY83_06570, partial [Flavobacteriia bacterium]